MTSLLLAALFLCPGAGWASAGHRESRNLPATSANVPPATAVALAATQDEQGPSQKAVEIARPFGFPVTNSMVVSWMVAVGLILFAQAATRHMKPVPEGAQNFWEWLVESLYTF